MFIALILSIVEILKSCLRISFLFLHKSVRTIPTTLFAAVTTTQQILSGEDHQSILEVIVITLGEHLSLVIDFH